MRQSIPDLRWVQTLEESLTGNMGIAVEGSNATVPGDDIWHGNGASSLALPTITPFTPKRWLEISHRGTGQFCWNISADPFITLSQISGTLNPDDEDLRVYVSVDWAKVPPNFGEVSTINISSSTPYGTQGINPQITVKVNKTSLPSNFTSGFVESAGQLAFEAEHYTRQRPTNNLSYTTLPKYGRTLSAVKLSNNLAQGLSAANAPALEYDFVTFTPTTATKGLNVTLILTPTHNINPKLPLAYMTQIDNLPPQRRNPVTDQKQPNFPIGWEKAVADSAWYNTTDFGAVPPGPHTLRVWLLEANMVLQKIVLDLGGVVYSHNGPPESYSVGRNGGDARVEP